MSNILLNCYTVIKYLQITPVLGGLQFSSPSVSRSLDGVQFSLLCKLSLSVNAVTVIAQKDENETESSLNQAEILVHPDRSKSAKKILLSSYC